jgi:lauroyl/myristoyl acyltransferase
MNGQIRSKERGKLIAPRDVGWLAYWALNMALRRFSPAFRLQNAQRMARICARLWLSVARSERDRTRDNLVRILNGQHTTRDLSGINAAHHEAHVWALLVPDILPRLTQAQIRQMGEVRGTEYLEAARAKGNGAVLLSAHYGTHGLITEAVLAAYGWPLTSVHGEESTPIGQQEPDGSWLYRKLIHPMRRLPRSSVRVITHGLVPDRQIATVLRSNEILLLQGDMHLSREEAAREHFSLPVPFLWGTAAFRSGPIRLAKMFKAPVLPAFGVRQGSRVIVEVEEPLTLTPGTSREDIAADLRAFLDRLEPRILAAPEQWCFTRHEVLQEWIRSEIKE